MAPTILIRRQKRASGGGLGLSHQVFDRLKSFEDVTVVSTWRTLQVLAYSVSRLPAAKAEAVAPT